MLGFRVNCKGLTLSIGVRKGSIVHIDLECSKRYVIYSCVLETLLVSMFDDLEALGVPGACQENTEFVVALLFLKEAIFWGHNATAS